MDRSESQRRAGASGESLNTQTLFELANLPADDDVIEEPPALRPGGAGRRGAETDREPLAPSEELSLRQAGRGEFQRLLALVAAIFFVTTLILSYWVYQLERPAQRPSGGQLNVALFEISRQGGTALPESGDKVLVFDLGDHRPFGRYRMEIVGSGQEVALAYESSRQPSAAGFTLSVADGALKPGPYQAELLGLTGKRRGESLGRFDFAVE